MTDKREVPANAPAAKVEGRPIEKRPGLGPVSLREFSIFFLLIGEIALFSLLSSNFLTASNFSNIILNSADLALIAAGLTLVIILGGIDVSTGAAVGVIAWVVGSATNSGLNPFLIVGLSLLIGLAMGTFNGVLVTKGRVTAIIATLGMLAVWRSVLFGLWGGSDLFSSPLSPLLAGGSILGIPAVSVVILVCFAVLWYVSRYRRFGRHVYAIGNDLEGARLNGVPVTRTIIMAYALLGLMVGIAAMIYMARTGVVQASSGTGLELSAIAAVVVGGTSITGGRGSVLSTLGGVFFIAVLQNGVVLTGVPPLWTGVLVGSFILAAVTIDLLGARVAQRRARA
jgi:ribose/xylose/arabinose/galactoside ABC-type transport system permease subunit